MSTSRVMALSAWLVASMFYAYQYILRVMPNIMMEDIKMRFNVDSGIFGQFSGAYYIGYCLAHLPIGIMLDRYTAKVVMPLCILLAAIGNLAIVFGDHWIYPVVGRMLIGVGASAAILGAFKIIRASFQEKYFTSMLSFTVTIGLLGAVYGGVPVAYLSSVFGYDSIICGLTFFGMGLAILSYCCIPSMEKSSHSSVIGDVVHVLTNKKVMMISFFAALMVGPMEGFADAWGSQFLKRVYALDSDVAGYVVSMIYIGMCFAPVLSRIAEKTGQYILTIAGAGIAMFSVFGALVSGVLSFSIMIPSFFLVGLCCAYQILAIYKASSYVDESRVGLATAIVNMIIMSFGYVFHTVIGVLIQYLGESNLDSWNYSIAFIPICLFIGVSGFLYIWVVESSIVKKQKQLKIA